MIDLICVLVCVAVVSFAAIVVANTRVAYRNGFSDGVQYTLRPIDPLWIKYASNARLPDTDIDRANRHHACARKGGWKG